MSKPLKVLINTHGGLGNQIFQIFYALNLSTKLDANLLLNHISYYKHKLPLEVPITKLDIGKPSNFDLILMHGRIGKIMEKTKFSPGNIKLLNKIFLDGYFQDSVNYRCFETQSLNDCLEKLRITFKISPCFVGCDLLHIRLGDFFKTEQEKLEQAKKSLSKACNGQHIITNDENIILLPENKSIIQKKNLKLIKTSNLSGYQLLKLFSTYRKITSNGSTLALWAALFSGAKLEIHNENLQNFYDFIITLNP